MKQFEYRCWFFKWLHHLQIQVPEFLCQCVVSLVEGWFQVPSRQQSWNEVVGETLSWLLSNAWAGFCWLLSLGRVTIQLCCL